jgi:3-hydroxyethyl bacteriochlorophyllide a dehydrogenase
MQTLAVVMPEPGKALLRTLDLVPPGPADVVIDVDWSGISAGTERLLWQGRMPDFPGMGYPLVPGYETAGRVIAAGAESGRTTGDVVFVPGARCFGDVRGLFGGAAARVVVPGARVSVVGSELGEQATLLALAATARHAVAAAHPELVIGHGALGRLIARITVAEGAPAPVVWETNAGRCDGATGYSVIAPDQDGRRDYKTIVDASGDASILDSLIGRLARGGEVVLAGFYSGTVGFSFPPAFMREARLRCAAEWQPADLEAVLSLLDTGRLSLDGLITHRRPAADADDAYQVAFGDPDCLKMILDWRDAA